jgi:hypothetical protein
MSKQRVFCASLLGVLAGQVSAKQSPERYRGHFVYSWEGGGFFLPCGWTQTRRTEDVARVFFTYLRADSIRWLPGRRPFRSHEGETTFVILRVPRLVKSSSDTGHRWFSADVDSMRRPSAADCPRG